MAPSSSSSASVSPSAVAGDHQSEASDSDALALLQHVDSISQANRQPPPPQSSPREDEDSEDDDDDIASKAVETYKNWARFNELLGQGSYKKVWRGLDQDAGREIAWNSVNLLSLSERDRARVYKECKLLRRMRHPFIIEILDVWKSVGPDHEEMCFATPRLSYSLKQHIAQLHPMKTVVIKKYSRQILEALVYLHEHFERPIIHRDVKAENLFVNGTTGDLQLGDFGLSTDNPANRSMIGTPGFMAPDLFDDDYDEKIDIWSCGMCVFEMATNQYPFLECNGVVGALIRKGAGAARPEGLKDVRDPEVLQFILDHLIIDPKRRPSARCLLFQGKFDLFSEDPQERNAAMQRLGLTEADIRLSLSGSIFAQYVQQQSQQQSVSPGRGDGPEQQTFLPSEASSAVGSHHPQHHQHHQQQQQQQHAHSLPTRDFLTPSIPPSQEHSSASSSSASASAAHVPPGMGLPHSSSSNSLQSLSSRTTTASSNTGPPSSRPDSVVGGGGESQHTVLTPTPVPSHHPGGATPGAGDGSVSPVESTLTPEQHAADLVAKRELVNKYIKEIVVQKAKDKPRIVYIHVHVRPDIKVSTRYDLSKDNPIDVAQKLVDGPLSQLIHNEQDREDLEGIVRQLLAQAVEPRLNYWKQKQRDSDVSKFMKFLAKLKLSQDYAQVFVDNEITFESLPALRKSDLKELIPKLGPRRVLENWLDQQRSGGGGSGGGGGGKDERMDGRMSSASTSSAGRGGKLGSKGSGGSGEGRSASSRKHGGSRDGAAPGGGAGMLEDGGRGTSIGKRRKSRGRPHDDDGRRQEEEEDETETETETEDGTEYDDEDETEDMTDDGSLTDETEDTGDSYDEDDDDDDDDDDDHLRYPEEVVSDTEDDEGTAILDTDNDEDEDGDGSTPGRGLPPPLPKKPQRSRLSRPRQPRRPRATDSGHRSMDPGDHDQEEFLDEGGPDIDIHTPPRRPLTLGDVSNNGVPGLEELQQLGSEPSSLLTSRRGSGSNNSYHPEMPVGTPGHRRHSTVSAPPIPETDDEFEKYLSVFTSPHAGSSSHHPLHRRGSIVSGGGGGAEPPALPPQDARIHSGRSSPAAATLPSSSAASLDGRSSSSSSRRAGNGGYDGSSAVEEWKRITPVPTPAGLIHSVEVNLEPDSTAVLQPSLPLPEVRDACARLIHASCRQLTRRLQVVLEEFPRLGDGDEHSIIHPFFRGWLGVNVSQPHYNLALEQVASAKRLLERVSGAFLAAVQVQEEPAECRELKRSGLGRFNQIVQRLKPALEYLEEVRLFLQHLPNLDPDLRTLIIAGFPNTGKSTFLNTITDAGVEVQPHAFTTKALHTGTTEYLWNTWQVIDTPGLLDRSLPERSSIEMQSILALEHLEAAVIFLVDISEASGYPIPKQVQLFLDLKTLFEDKPVLLVCSNSDRVRLEALDPEPKALLESLRPHTATNRLLEMNTLDREEAEAVKIEACKALLAHEEAQRNSPQPEQDPEEAIPARPPRQTSQQQAPNFPSLLLREIEQTQEILQLANAAENFLNLDLDDILTQQQQQQQQQQIHHTQFSPPPPQRRTSLGSLGSPGSVVSSSASSSYASNLGSPSSHHRIRVDTRDPSEIPADIRAAPSTVPPGPGEGSSAASSSSSSSSSSASAAVVGSASGNHHHHHHHHPSRITENSRASSRTKEDEDSEIMSRFLGEDDTISSLVDLNRLVDGSQGGNGGGGGHPGSSFSQSASQAHPKSRYSYSGDQLPVQQQFPHTTSHGQSVHHRGYFALTPDDPHHQKKKKQQQQQQQQRRSGTSAGHHPGQHSFHTSAGRGRLHGGGAGSGGGGGGGGPRHHSSQSVYLPDRGGDSLFLDSDFPHHHELPPGLTGGGAISPHSPDAGSDLVEGVAQALAARHPPQQPSQLYPQDPFRRSQQSQQGFLPVQEETASDLLSRSSGTAGDPLEITTSLPSNVEDALKDVLPPPENAPLHIPVVSFPSSGGGEGKNGRKNGDGGGGNAGLRNSQQQHPHQSLVIPLPGPPELEQEGQEEQEEDVQSLPILDHHQHLLPSPSSASGATGRGTEPQESILEASSTSVSPTAAAAAAAGGGDGSSSVLSPSKDDIDLLFDAVRSSTPAQHPHQHHHHLNHHQQQQHHQESMNVSSTGTAAAVHLESGEGDDEGVESAPELQQPTVHAPPPLPPLPLPPEEDEALTRSFVTLDPDDPFAGSQVTSDGGPGAPDDGIGDGDGDGGDGGRTVGKS